MRYEVTVEIDADPSTVWAALTDVERWPEWTRSVTAVQRLEDGPLGLGSTASVQQPRLTKTVYTVTEFEAGRSFAWAAGAVGVKTVAAHYLVPRGEDGTDVRLVVNQTGPFTPFVRLLVGQLVLRYLMMEAEGLKSRSEGGI
jgi:uncharacterized protein YndB with AHSA1/START domain